MKVTCDNHYANQRPFKGLSIGVVLGILIIGLILLSVSAQAADSNQKSNLDQTTPEVTCVTAYAGVLNN